MSLYKLLFPLLLSIIFISVSCKKEVVSSSEDCRISARVDGVAYRWDLLSSCALTNGDLQVGDIAGDEAELTITPFDGRGSYPTINPNFTITLFLTLDATTQIYAADVEIEITSSSQSRVEGTFEGIFTDVVGNTYQVTNGKIQGVF